MLLVGCNAFIGVLGETVEEIITAAVTPALGVITSDDAPEDALPASATDAGNYSSTDGTISAAGIAVNWNIADPTTPQPVGTVPTVSILVTDSEGNEHTFGPYSQTVVELGVNQITQGNITFTWDGPARVAGNYLDGRAYVVVPSGQTVNITSVTPAPITDGGLVAGNAQVDPLRDANPVTTSSQTATNAQAYDARAVNTYDASLIANFPQQLSPGQRIVKQVPIQTVTEGLRQGLPEEYGTLLVVDTEPPVGAMASSPVRWAGAPTMETYTVDFAAKQALLPSRGGVMVGEHARALTLLGTDMPAAAQNTLPNGNSGGYEAMWPNRSGVSNYGGNLGEDFGNLFISILRSNDPTYRANTLAYLTRVGLDFEPIWQSGLILDANGGHRQMELVPTLVALWATDRLSLLPTMIASAGYNEFSQLFEITQPVLDALEHHTSHDLPYPSRGRNILTNGVNGLEVDVPTFQSGGQGDPSQVSFRNMRLIRVSDGAEALVLSQDVKGHATSTTNAGGDEPVTVTIDAQPTPPFADGEEVYFKARNDPRLGEYDWNIGEDLNSYNPSGRAVYRNVNQWSRDAIAIVELGLLGDHPRLDAIAEYVGFINEDDQPPSDDMPHHLTNDNDENYWDDFGDIVNIWRQPYGPATAFTITPTQYAPYDPGIGVIQAVTIEADNQVVAYITDTGTIHTEVGFTMTLENGTYTGQFDNGQAFTLTISVGEAEVEVVDTSDVFLAAIASQSEPSVAAFITRPDQTSLYTQLYPDLLAGVDAKVVSRASSISTSATEPAIFDVSQANIDARTISPGTVAYSNLWHTGSGGRPLRLGDLTLSGTSDHELADDDLTDRNAADDRAVVAMFAANFGPIAHTFICWWNAIASGSKTPVDDYAQTFLGLNPDGTPDTSGVYESPLLDLSGQDRGILPNTAKISFLLPGTRIDHPTDDITAARNVNYETQNDGGFINGMIKQNATPANAQRQVFLDFIPEANRGSTGITPALTKFGDYVDGVKIATGQSAIHPSVLHQDGQILFAQDMAAQALVEEGHVELAPREDRWTHEPDGSKWTLHLRIPAGGVLGTKRIRDGIAVASPRPHQQVAMGFVIERAGDDIHTRQPVFRTDVTDDVEYPPAYQGTVVFANAGEDVGGGVWEARVDIIPEIPIANGDRCMLDPSGGYGGFVLHGSPDHDADLYLDGLRVYLAALDDGTSFSYPGLPVPNQLESDPASGIVAGDTTAPDAPVVTTANGTTLAGTAEPLSDIGGTVDGVSFATTADAQGDWSITGTFEDGDAYSVTSTDAANNESAATTGTISVVPPAVGASRALGDDAYLTGPVLAAGTEALTFVIDADIPEDTTTGFQELLEYISTTFDVALDVRNGKRSLQITVESSSGAKAFQSVTTADGVMPAGRHTLVVSTSLNSDGNNAAILKVFVDGVEEYSNTATSTDTTFAVNRSLELLRDDMAGTFYELSVFGGTHAQGYTDDGDVTGLTLLHSVSGGTAAFNTPGSGLTKSGADEFT